MPSMTWLSLAPTSLRVHHFPVFPVAPQETKSLVQENFGDI
jgi:hypothetical protein